MPVVPRITSGKTIACRNQPTHLNGSSIKQCREAEATHFLWVRVLFFPLPMLSFDERYTQQLSDSIGPQATHLAFRELFWRDYQPWLLERGYRLRPRYQPDWIPSWSNFDEMIRAEDSKFLPARFPS
ncbi:hypothetical protein B0H16DRAFT_1435819 [Mycena metata]|uniref:Uncharacterized protein n=1 Tax=Mycena metata TaxID=1033252 RepID=A0AAD7MEY4_9AGAR|nr:hypothetical protein B0H16DRAFT_1435819 [Mycena metata]